jgi:cbb3-type cytochrome oxidase maturation protein
MSVIVILILASLLVATGFLVAFIWAVRSGQYEDTSTPALRVLADDARGAAVGVPPRTPEPPTSA